jgi:Fic family protein
MNLETRKKGSKTYYYLAQSIRIRNSVRKLRIYLGVNLSPPELSERRREAEPRLQARLEAGRQISDPFAAILSEKELEELKGLETKADPKIVHLSEKDWQRFTESFAYNTNAIEGSTIGEKEAADILEKDSWPDKPKEEISETYGVSKAIDCIRKTKEHLSLPLILELHRLVFSNSKPFAGKFRPRGTEVAIRDSQGRIIHRGAPSTQVKNLLLELVRWYNKNRSRYPPLVLAAVVHNQFENIHPFADGNGRVGRLLLNNILLKHGLPPLNIELARREEYYLSLQTYELKHDLRPTINLMLKEYKALKRLLKKK